MTIRSLFITLLLSVMLASCGSSRQAADQEEIYNAIGAGPDTRLSSAQLKQLYNAMTQRYGKWEDVKVPVKLSLKSPRSMSVSGVMTMKANEYIHLSLRVLGMEMASLMVTTDSVFATYKLEKIYLAESIGEFTSSFPSTVGNLQSLLTGRVFALGGGVPKFGDCKMEGTGTAWTITPGDAPKGMGYSFEIATPKGEPTGLTVELPSRKDVTVDYSDYYVTSAGPMARRSVVTVPSSKGELKAEIDLSLNKAEWNTGSTKIWSVPRGYRRVTRDAVMKIVGGLSKK